MTKSSGRGRGGARPNAGRLRGSKNKITVLGELLPALAERDMELPLYGLLNRIGDPTLDPKYRDLLRIATLPYLHPKPRSDMVVKPAYLMSTEELRQVRDAEIEHERQLARGRPTLRLVKSRK